MVDQLQAATVLNRLSERLRHRRGSIDRYINYLTGETGRLRFASEEFQEFFSQRFDGFSDNWCLPVAQAPAERMKHTGIRLPGESRPNAELHRLFVANDGERGLSEAILLMIATGYAYALVSPEDGVSPRLTFEHPAQAVVEHDPATGRPRYGLVMWSDDDGYDYGQLLTNSGHVWKLRRPTTKPEWAEWTETELFGWEEREGVDPLTIVDTGGRLPLVEFRNQSLLNFQAMSDISGVASMQDAINLTWAYLLNGLDYASLPQRTVLNSGVPKVPILDKNGNKVGERLVELEELYRERIMFINGENVSIGEWSAANLDVFSKVIEHAVEHIAAQTRTPPHYLVARMVNTAAESLTISEAGLVSKTQERIGFVIPALREIYALLAYFSGNPDRAEAARSARILFRGIQYRSEAQLADALQKKRAMGYPLEYILEQDGVDPEDIPRILAMRDKEAAMDPVADIARELSAGGGVDGDG